jgi:ActR/RegA family two-component response regulator
MDDLEALLSEYDLPTSKAVEVEKPKILVIDDDESIRRGMHRALAHKYDVLAAIRNSNRNALMSLLYSIPHFNQSMISLKSSTSTSLKDT